MKTPKLPTNSECRFGNDGKVCSTDEALELVKRLIEKLAAQNNKDVRVSTMSKESIIDKAKEFLDCDDESCIFAKKEFEDVVGVRTAEDIKDKIFKPSGPWKDNTWLSNVNIDDVLDQWADIYPGYSHIPYKMIDTLKSVKIPSLYRDGIKTFSIVINTDKSTGKGIHWFCIFVEFTDKECFLEYFNSTGSRPMKQVHEWLHKTKHDIEQKLNKPTKIVNASKIELQEGTSECGLFALWYIYSRLNGIPAEYFSKPESASDDTMFEFRKYVFRKYK